MVRKLSIVPHILHNVQIELLGLIASNTILFKNLLIGQMVMKFLAFCGTQKMLTRRLYSFKISFNIALHFL